MDRFVKFVLGDAWEYAKDTGWLFVLVLCLPVWQIIASFGHHTVEMPVLGGVLFWKLLIIAALGIGYLAWTHARTTGLFFALCLLLIAATGKSSSMQTIGPVITLFLTNILLYGLAVLIWAATVSGYALVPGQQTTIAVGLQPARQNFQSFMIFAFWLNLTAFAVARAGHLLPAWLILTMLSVALIILPGALAKTGHDGFLFMLRLTVIAFIASIGLSIFMALQQLGVIGTWDELSAIVQAFLWGMTDLQSYWLAWLVALVSVWLLKTMVLKLRGDTTEATKVNITIPFYLIQGVVTSAYVLAVIFWLFHTQRNGLAWILNWFLPYVGFPVRMPMMYTPNQAFVLVLLVVSVLLLLYKAVRGDESKITWDRVWLIVSVLWIGIFGGKWLFFNVDHVRLWP